ncbi:MAG: flagellar basal body P-ring formation protein FlgA [Verrucomicrobiota bacterium]|jgi:flagella basal body P-ring formation protein FlgA
MLLLGLLALLTAPTAILAEEAALVLLPAAAVDGEGIFLSQVLGALPASALPHIRLADSPAFGQVTILSRSRIHEIALAAAPDLVSTNWTGAANIRITRRARTLNETDLREQLTAVLQRDNVGAKGDLELRLTRPWSPIAIPDDPFTLKILDLPTSGVSSSFVVRFELRTAREVVGTWQAALQARVHKEIWTARSALKPGQLFSEADIARERRDVLALREAPLAMEIDATLEIAENVQAGAPLYSRSVRLRPVIHRGQVVDAQVQENGMVISLKVEALENGAPGQLLRVRNIQSRKEFRGKIQNENTILVLL